MIHIPTSNIWIGNQFELYNIPNGWARVHVGSKFYPEFKDTKVFETDNENEIYIDWEDSGDEHDFEVEDLIEILDFIGTHNHKTIFIHCEYAQSRSPAVTMTYLAKRTDILPDQFVGALEKFSNIYPNFVYPSGITKFLKSNWQEIV